MPVSEKSHWEKFWARERNIKEVYPHSRCLIDNLTNITDVTGKKVLEVGAGSGRDSIKISSMGGNGYVVDYASSSLQTIREISANEKADLTLIKGDAFKLPFKDESFDVVFHQGLLEHFRNPEDLLKENIRVMKKGGLLLVDVPQKYHFYTVVKHILMLFGKWFAGWETEFTVSQLENMLKKKGLSIVAVYGDWLNPSFLYRMTREALFKIGIKLPLYPPGIGFLKALRLKIKKSVINNRMLFYTFVNIGIIGKK